MKAKTLSKTVLVSIVQSKSCQGWEDSDSSLDSDLERAVLRNYDDNEKGVPHRLIKRLVLRADYEAGNY